MKEKLFLLCLFISILFLPLGIKANEKTKTYKFYDIENKLVATQEVHEGDILNYVNVPKTIENKRFVGWFLDGTKFEDFGKKISLDDKTEAIIKALYEDAIYIRYHDALGNILKTDEVTKNSTVTIAKDYPMVEAITLTTKHDGWSLTKGGLTDVSGSFNVTDKSINLYPIIKEGYWISFQTNSESSIAKQFIDIKEAVKKVKKPSNPSKQGYIFTKWYEDETLTNEYDFNKEVTKPMTLYAGYEPGTATYQVNYYIEYQKDIPNNKWDYQLIATELKTGTTGGKTEYNKDLIFTNPYNVFQEGYELNTEKTVEATINGDGTTIYNIYYKARLFDITVSTESDNNSSRNMVPILKEIYKKKYPNIRYSQNIEFIWADLNTFGIIDYMKDKNLRFVDKTHRHMVDPRDFKIFNEDTMYLVIQEINSTTYTFEIYGEVLDGEAPKGYDKVKNMSARGKNDNREYYLIASKSFSTRDIPVLKAERKSYYNAGMTTMPEFSDGHYRFRDNGIIEMHFINESGVITAYDEDGSVITYRGARPLRVYLFRNKYNLIYETNGAEALETEKEIPYERNISYLDNKYFIEGKTIRMINGQEVEFAGWYTDATFNNKFSFNINMPYNDVILYAKWMPKTYTVKFNTNGGESVEDQKGIEYGGTIAEPDTKKDGYIFLGWSYNNKPFNFASGITEDMTLNAEWKSIKAYKVLYDLNGGKGETPLDKDKYYAGAGAIVLKHDDIKAPFNKVFVGWGLDDSIYYPNNLAKVKEGGIVLKAIWKDKYKETGDIMPNTGVEKTVSLQSLIILNIIFLGLALGTYKIKKSN